MKSLLTKIPAMFAMLVGGFSLFLYVLDLYENYVLKMDTETWIVSALVALLCVGIFFIDAIISFVKAIKKNDAKFNAILALVLVGAIPMVLIFGQRGLWWFNIIWNVYLVGILVLEVIAIVRACKTINKK